MVINIKKSCCLRIGPRCNVRCANSQDGRLFSWVFELRYLGVFIVRSRVFKFSLLYAKRLFHRAVDSLFGILLNLASEVVIICQMRQQHWTDYKISLCVCQSVSE